VYIIVLDLCPVLQVEAGRVFRTEGKLGRVVERAVVCLGRRQEIIFVDDVAAYDATTVKYPAESDTACFLSNLDTGGVVAEAYGHGYIPYFDGVKRYLDVRNTGVGGNGDVAVFAKRGRVGRWRDDLRQLRLSEGWGLEV